jgi:DNA segregation ATPase FtsK/SpoIIIE, S-DNA-T family
VAVGLQEQGMEPWFFDPSVGDPHFFVFGDGESGKTTFLQTWLTRLAESTRPDDAQVVLVDYRRTLLEVVPEDHLRAYAASEPAAREVIETVAAEMATRLPGADVTAAQLRERSWWTGPEIYVVVDDYDLVVTPSGNPLSPLLPYLAQGRDVGLHVVLTRRAAGAAKMMYEPITARLREVSPTGLLLSGDRDEGPLIGPVRASDQPPGRGILVSRRQQPMLVQVAISDHALTDA